MQTEHRFIESNGIKIHIAEAGTGPLVLLCHGFPEVSGIRGGIKSRHSPKLGITLSHQTCVAMGRQIAPRLSSSIRSFI